MGKGRCLDIEDKPSFSLDDVLWVLVVVVVEEGGEGSLKGLVKVGRGLGDQQKVSEQVPDQILPIWFL